jgi:hypothetical protein
MTPDEPPSQNIRNAAAILAVAPADAYGRRTLTASEYTAIQARLMRAAAQLEAGDCGIAHGLPAPIGLLEGRAR